jgi:hypothetical protein
MAPPRPTAASYRDSSRTDPDPTTEADVIADLFRRTTALRRRLLMLTLAGSLGGGAAGVALYVSLAAEVYGRVAGAFFAAGGMLAFTLMHRLSGVAARSREARWIAELSGRYALDPAALVEAMKMFGPGSDGGDEAPGESAGRERRGARNGRRSGRRA